MVGAFGTLMPGPVASWDDSDKLAEAIRRSTKYMPASLGHQVESLLTPANLAIMSGTVAVWAGAHFFALGEIVDVGLLLVGAFCIGWSITDVMRDLVTFGTTAIRARSEDDLDRAGQAFANAVIVAGITAVMAILLRRSATEISARGPSWVDAARPKDPGLIKLPPDPQAGELWRKPTATGDPTLPTGTGTTSPFGDVEYSTAGSATDQELARTHELVHQFLTPRFRPLRQFRMRLRISAYVRTALFQYLEEALAETTAQLRVNGVSGLIEGIKFPVKNGYLKLDSIPLAQGLISEGAAVGTIAVGAQQFTVRFIEGADNSSHAKAHRRR